MKRKRTYALVRSNRSSVEFDPTWRVDLAENCIGHREVFESKRKAREEVKRRNEEMLTGKTVHIPDRFPPDQLDFGDASE